MSNFKLWSRWGFQKLLEIGNWKLEIGNFWRSQKGFSLAELSIALGIIALLIGIITINLLATFHKTSINSTVSVLIADIKNQQSKAMIGATEGRSASDNYGIYFSTTYYVLFHSAVYNSLDSTNLKINLDNNLQFTNITFPSSNIIFSQGTGEVLGFVNGSNTITISSTLSTEQKIITLNKYGVITNVQ